MPRASKPWWQQATALVSLSAGGAITGFSFMPKAAVDFSSPTSLPVNLLALQHSVRQAPASDATLRTAIVNVAQHYLQLAQDKTPAEMEAMIWQQDSLDHADHGPSCGAFASLTLELAAKVVGQESWVTGGSSYPWPLHSWADVRVDENPASPGIISIQQDARAHGRWHPLGDGYQPQPGDWVLFQGHVEVITEYAHGVLHTIGGDSLPNFSVNAHQYAAPLASEGVAGFVNNGALGPAGPASPASTTRPAHGDHGGSQTSDGQTSTAATAGQAAIPGTAAAGAPASDGSARGGPPQQPAAKPHSRAGQRRPTAAKSPKDRAQASRTPGRQAQGDQAQGDQAAGLAAIPGTTPAGSTAAGHQQAQRATTSQAQADAAPGRADIPGAAGPATGQHRQHDGTGNGPAGKARTGATDLAAVAGGAAIPGVADPGEHDGSGSRPAAGHQDQPASTAPVDEAASRQAFINAVAPGAIASQRAYGVPAAVTIAQAIEESNWGQSLLASKDHNLFGMKGTGPAGSEALPTQEYENGQWITTTAPFRVYHNFAESIDDHGRLLADSGYYRQAMAVRRAPNAFASALTGVYATDPTYGAKLIGLMREYNLYRYDAGTSAARSAPAATHRPRPAPSHQTTSPAPAPAASTSGTAAASPTHTAPTTATPTPTTAPTPAHAAQPTPTATGTQIPAAGSADIPVATPTHSPAAAPHTQAATPRHPATAAAGHTAQASPATSHRTGTSHVPAASHTATASPGGLAGQASIPGVPDASATGHADATTAQSPDSAVTRADRRPAAERPTARRPARRAATQSVVLTAEEMPLHASPAAHEARPAEHLTSPASAAARPASQQPRSASSAGHPADHRPTPAVRPASPGARPASQAARPASSRNWTALRRYRPEIPPSVHTAFLASAKVPLRREEPLYREVAAHADIPWKVLAAADWMQCEARSGYSPVHGEKLGAINLDGTSYTTRSAALEQCADDLRDLAWSVYQVDLTERRPLSVGDLASVFAAFRWGRLLVAHRTSALEFPFSVAGLTTAHLHMRWPKIAEPDAPDKPGTRFRKPFGAVPIVLGLGYPAVV